MSTKTRFEKEAKGNSEMAYSMWKESTRLKDNFLCSRLLRLSVFPWCKDNQRIVML